MKTSALKLRVMIVLVLCVLLSSCRHSACAKLLSVVFKSSSEEFRKLRKLSESIFFNHFIYVLFYDWDLLSVCRPEATKMQNKQFLTSQT